MDDLSKAVTSAATAVIERLVTYVPSVLGAVLLIFVGWILARLLRAVTARAALLVDALLARTFSSRGSDRVRVGRSASVLGTIVFWLVLLFFVAAATHVLGLPIFTDWISKLIEYLPTFAAGMLIIAAGYILSGFLADLARAAAPRLPSGQREILARTIQGAILVASILVGAEQIGIRVTFLAIVVGAVFVALAGGVAVAASLGARSYVENLIGAHYLRQAFEIGQRVRVAGHEGRILELNATGMVIETDGGRVTLPGKLYHDQPIVVMTSQGEHG